MKKLHCVILLICFLGTAIIFHQFLSQPRAIWKGLGHDRNGHYCYGLDMALALEHADVPQFFSQLSKGKVWPPLHGLLVAATQILSGNDWRLAVLPSLTGWFLMIWCVYYTAQKIAAYTGIGWAAGAVALLFATMSPGYRLYATDVMLESLGAGLTMLVLAAYARAVEQRDSKERWRMLAIAMTLLFFEKYNYWMIVVLCLTFVESGMLTANLREWSKKIIWRKQLRAQIGEPLNWVLLASVFLTGWLFARGPSEMQILGHRISLYPPNNLVTVAYAVLFLRIAVEIHRTDWKPKSAEVKMLWRWHVLPVAVSFLLPQRLGVFIGFLSPTNHDAPPRNIPAAAVYYANSFIADYNISWWMAIVAAILTLVALSRFKCIGQAGRAVLICVVLGAALNILHPNQKSRYLHSWLPALWTATGVGAAALLGSLPRRSLVAGSGVALLALAAVREWTLPGHSPEALQRNNPSSDLDMSDTWLPELENAHRVAFLSGGCDSFVQWTFLDRYRERSRMERPDFRHDNSGEAIRADFERWLATTNADTIVLFDEPINSADLAVPGIVPNVLDELAGCLARQSKFKQTKNFVFPSHGFTAGIWTRD